MFPLTAWGRNYVAVRSYPRGRNGYTVDGDVWRILASQDGTQVTLDPQVAMVPTLDKGQWYEFLALDNDFLISSNEPILVGQFLLAEQFPLVIAIHKQRRLRPEHANEKVHRHRRAAERDSGARADAQIED